jgi:hypothetical protein
MEVRTVVVSGGVFFRVWRVGELRRPDAAKIAGLQRGEMPF